MVPGNRQVRGEGAAWGLDPDAITGPHLADEPAGDRAALDLPDADPGCGTGRGADRVGAPLVAAADRQELAGSEGEDVRQFGRNGKGERGGVVGQPFDLAHHELMEGVARHHRVPPLAHSGFTASKGSPQAWQRYSDLQAVALNSA